MGFNNSRSVNQEYYMQVSCVSLSAQNDCNNSNFKSAVPVFIQIKTDAAKTVPVVGEELNAMFMRKTELMLNDSLKRGKNTVRDGLVDRFSHASDCIACGQCEGVCPQHLPIITLMQEAVEKFEGQG